VHYASDSRLVNIMNFAIIGAGAAGCFCAIELKRRVPGAQVTIYEAGRVPLAKVAQTGGGRCNLTNSFEGIRDMRQAYPRGAVLMKRALQEFSNEDTLEWFRREGVEFVLQEDHCWFPKSQDAMEIVRTLTRLCDSLGVQTLCQRRVVSLTPVERDITLDSAEATGKSGTAESPGFIIETSDGEQHHHDVVIVTVGGGQHHFMDGLGLKTVPGVPSLFSLNIKDEGLNALMGTTVDHTRVSIVGEKISAEGTLLLSHWGISGPVTLNLSAYAARLLALKSYRDVKISINWLCASEEECRATVSRLLGDGGGKIIANQRPASLASRLWEHLLQRSGIQADTKCCEIGKTAVNRLVNTLINDQYELAGKCKFQPGFVTSGGVCLEEINYNTMQHKTIPGLYFAGEVLDIDAITGGFNLQAAWSTAYLVAKNFPAK